MKPAALGLLALLLFASGCASTKSISELKRIQDEEGFHSKSLYYVGSTKSFHYFDQYKLWDRGWLLNFIPGIETDGYDAFKVSYSQMTLPSDLEFLRRSYEGEDDSRRAKIRIKDRPNFRAEKRKTAGERLAEKYPDGIDFSKARLKKIDEMKYEIIFDN